MKHSFNEEKYGNIIERANDAHEWAELEFNS
jgi:hypothetical protein